MTVINKSSTVRTLINTFALFLCLTSVNAFAINEIYTGFFSSSAIKGYDTVAYFTEGKAVKGSKKYRYKWKDTNWNFSSQENADLFAANPEKYAPQYGGWCAYAISQNTTAGIEPDQFSVVDGKLYLNYDKKIQDRWVNSKEKFIIDADKYWPDIVNK